MRHNEQEIALVAALYVVGGVGLTVVVLYVYAGIGWVASTILKAAGLL